MNGIKRLQTGLAGFGSLQIGEYGFPLDVENSDEI